MNESFNSLIKGKLFQYLDIYDKMKYIPEEKKIETPIISPPSQKDVKEPEKKIITFADVEHFQKSNTHADYLQFLGELQEVNIWFYQGYYVQTYLSY